VSEALAARCASQPGAVRRRRWGETAYAVGRRVFAFLGTPEEPSVTVKVRREQRRTLRKLSFVQRPRILGLFGWLTIHVGDGESLRLALELVDRSYELMVLAQRR
jgi:predicted DNA-binding protein (MmcQ/YjbR family)